jgi:hypothetical protein
MQALYHLSHSVKLLSSQLLSPHLTGLQEKQIELDSNLCTVDSLRF